MELRPLLKSYGCHSEGGAGDDEMVPCSPPLGGERGGFKNEINFFPSTSLKSSDLLEIFPLNSLKEDCGDLSSWARRGLILLDKTWNSSPQPHRRRCHFFYFSPSIPERKYQPLHDCQFTTCEVLGPSRAYAITDEHISKKSQSQRWRLQAQDAFPPDPTQARSALPPTLLNPFDHL